MVCLQPPIPAATLKPGRHGSRARDTELGAAIVPRVRRSRATMIVTHLVTQAPTADQRRMADIAGRRAAIQSHRRRYRASPGVASLHQLSLSGAWTTDCRCGASNYWWQQGDHQTPPYDMDWR